MKQQTVQILLPKKKLNRLFKAGLDRVQTDLNKELFQEPKVIKTILPNQTYKNTITSWNEIKNYLLIDRVTDSTIPKITNITVNQVLGTVSKFTKIINIQYFSFIYFLYINERDNKRYNIFFCSIYSNIINLYF